MTQITLENLGKNFGSFTALAGMNLTIADGEFVALLGPSGCGKSTTMNMIAGMLQPSTGSISFDGRDMGNVPMAQRGVGFVFQNYAIFTHMTVRENLAYGLKAQGMASAEVTKRVEEIASLLQLESMFDRRAGGLSVNILQRLAIGRSAIVEPAIFLLDEPLSNVDAAFRAVMRTELKQLQRQFKQTMVYVTHDQLEAMTMADRIAVMDHGKLLQVGTPLEVYNNPVDTFVARFIGSPGMNLIDGEITSSGKKETVNLKQFGSFGPVPKAVLGKLKCGDGKVIFGFRPEMVELDSNGSMKMPVNFVERIGARTLLHLGDPDDNIKITVSNHEPVPKQGELAQFTIPPKAARYFDPQTGNVLRGEA